MRFKLSEDQARQLEPFVKDQSILDLGAAELLGSDLLVELGAQDVLAVDRHPMPTPSSSRITTLETHFHQLKESRPVVFASWIVNWPVNIEPFLTVAGVIISISKNTDASCCGYGQMWKLLMRREILLHVPEFKNTLTVYGPKLVTRAPTGEEYAAMRPMRMYSFAEAEELARKSPAGEGEAVASGSPTS